MKNWLLLFLLIGPFLSGQSKLHFSNISIEQALQRAKAEDKMIFIDSYASYCLPCKQMDVEFKNPSLIEYFNKNFVNVKVDMEGPFGKAFKNKFQIVFLPTLIFVDYSGKQRTKIDNVVSANELLSVGKFINNKYGPNGTGEVVTNTNPAKQKLSSNPFGSFPPSTPKVEPVKPEAILKKDEKILYVLDDVNSDLPPHLLKEEAYFRMQLMDGSHIESAHKYLKTQSNWLSEDNMRFVFDFISDCHSDLFQHVVDNRAPYENLLGKQQINETFQILVRKELDRAFPRPSQSEAKKLLGLINLETAEQKAEAYYLNVLYDNSDFKTFNQIGHSHLDKYNNVNPNLAFKVCEQSIQISDDKKTLKKNKSILENIIASNKEHELYFYSLAQVHLKLKDKKGALVNIKKALSICQSKGIQNKAIVSLFEQLQEI